MRDPRANVVQLVTIILAIIVIFGMIDLTADIEHGVSRFHLASEFVTILLSLGAILWLGRVWFHMRSEALAATESLNQHLLGLAESIDAQFRAWDLTKAEFCVAMLLLKGLSHQEIATHCDRSERTIRQHAVAVYKKSGLTGRAELAAFFMEDLLPPVEMRGNNPSKLTPSNAGSGGRGITLIHARGRGIAQARMAHHASGGRAHHPRRPSIATP